MRSETASTTVLISGPVIIAGSIFRSFATIGRLQPIIFATITTHQIEKLTTKITLVEASLPSVYLRANILTMFTAARTRPKFIGGMRAQYDESLIG